MGKVSIYINDRKEMEGKHNGEVTNGRNIGPNKPHLIFLVVNVKKTRAIGPK